MPCSYNIYGKYSCSENFNNNNFNNNLDMCSQMVERECDDKNKILLTACPKQCEARKKYCNMLISAPEQCDEEMRNTCPYSCKITKKKAPQSNAPLKPKK